MESMSVEWDRQYGKRVEEGEWGGCPGPHLVDRGNSDAWMAYRGRGFVQSSRELLEVSNKSLKITKSPCQPAKAGHRVRGGSRNAVEDEEEEEDESDD